MSLNVAVIILLCYPWTARYSSLIAMMGRTIQPSSCSTNASVPTLLAPIISIIIIMLDPDILPRMQVDKGAIKFVISGANIMCPGLTSKGARMPDEMIEKDQVVAIYAEGKENAVAIGKMVLSSEEM